MQHSAVDYAAQGFIICEICRPSGFIREYHLIMHNYSAKLDPYFSIS